MCGVIRFPATFCGAQPSTEEEGIAPEIGGTADSFDTAGRPIETELSTAVLHPGGPMTTAGFSFRHTVLGLVVALCASFASVAAADDFARAGFYIGAGGSYASADLIENEIEDAISGVSVDIHDAPGFNVRAGARFLRFLGLEVQYEWLDDYDIDLSVSPVSGKVNVEQQTLTANLKVYPVPVWRIQPYILAGVGFQHVEVKGSVAGGFLTATDTDDVLAARAALGLDVYLTNHIALYGEAGVTYSDYRVEVPSAIGDDIPFLLNIGGQVGLMWRF